MVLPFLSFMGFPSLSSFGAPRWSSFPHSTRIVPFGSVTIYDVGKSFDVHCMSDGFTKNRVLPLPEPPITRIFLFLAYFGCFGRLFMVSRSVCVKGILFSNTGSVYGFMSSAPPHEAFCQVLFLSY